MTRDMERESIISQLYDKDSAGSLQFRRFGYF